MSSTATRFVDQIRRNLESWRAHEIDFVTFNEQQRQTWAAIRTGGADLEAEVLHALQVTASPAAPHTLAYADRPTMQPQTENRETRGFKNRCYFGEISRGAAPGPILRVSPVDLCSCWAEPRRVASFVYELAAEMERRSHELEAHWTIAADVEVGQIAIQLTGDHEAELADELVANIATQHRLL